MEIKRNIHLERLIKSKHNGMIKVMTGIRRCGKSYLLMNLFRQHLLDGGVNESHIIMLDLENRRNKKLRELKELCYKEALAKQNAIIKELREEANMDKERIDYLVTINKFLEAAIRDLKYDLGEN